MEAERNKKVRKHPKGDHGEEPKGTLRSQLFTPLKCFLFFFEREKMRKSFKRLMCFSTKSHDLQTRGRITGLVTD
ncbi:hypothetical protein PAMP_007321 [Pampus punctatissimus]